VFVLGYIYTMIAAAIMKGRVESDLNGPSLGHNPNLGYLILNKVSMELPSLFLFKLFLM